MRSLARAVLAFAATALLLTLLPSTAGAKLVMFSTPSHNIGCALDKTFARCDVARHTWRTGKPRGCMSDWGNGFAVERRGRATGVCAGDTVLNPRGPVLAYGKSRAQGVFTCTSRRSGVTCRNGSNGHGFMVSRSSYRVF